MRALAPQCRPPPAQVRHNALPGTMSTLRFARRCRREDRSAEARAREWEALQAAVAAEAAEAAAQTLAREREELRAALAFLELQEAGDAADVAERWGELASAHEQMLELEQRAASAQNQASPSTG